MTNQLPRSVVTAVGLEKTITVAVQQSAPDCGAFIGVYVEHVPNHPSGANWDLKGVKYGRAPRSSCDAALQSIVSNLQERYVIEASRSPSSPNAVPISRQPFKAGSPLAAAYDRVKRFSYKT